MKRAILAVSVAVFGVLGSATAAFGAPTPPDPASEAPALFNSGWTELLGTITALMPFAIGAGLVVLIARRVTSSTRKGKAPGLTG